MTVSDEQLHIGLERMIAPRVRAGVQVTIAGAILLILLAPNVGLVAKFVPPPVGWFLSAIAAVVLGLGVAMVVILPAYYRKLSLMMKHSNPEQMRVTLRFEHPPGGNVKIMAELPTLASENDGQIRAV